MLHQMKLYRDPFEKIANGTKTVELRLNDEKRRRVQVGDFIEFTMTDEPDRKLQVRVTALHPFGSFTELFASVPKAQCGFAPDVVPDMDAFYSPEQQAANGVLGIEFRLTDLQKFLDAQEYGYSFGETYAVALREVRNERKNEHWIWYVFPQIDGLGWSGTSKYFSIRNLQEARDYFAHPILGARLIEITQALMNCECNDLMVIFGDPDAGKVRSCMTLFKYAAPDEPLFGQVIDRFCMGNEDDRTTSRLYRK